MTEQLPDLRDEPGNGLEWFGREVAAALAHKGSSQRQLADATGYKEPYVSKVKSGTARASAHFAQGCDRFFETSGYFARLLVRVSERGHPGWFLPYINLEKQASRTENYSNALIMIHQQDQDATLMICKPSAVHQQGRCHGAEFAAAVYSRVARS